MRKPNIFTKFLREDDGVALIEFAMVLPFLLVAYLGFVQLAAMNSLHSRVADTGSTINDIISKVPQIGRDEIDAAMQAGLAIAREDGRDIKIRIAGVAIDENGNTNVVWSRSKNTAIAAVGSSYQLPPSLLVRKGFVVATRTSLDWDWSLSKKEVNGAMTFEYDFYHVPRSSEVTECENC